MSEMSSRDTPNSVTDLRLARVEKRDEEHGEPLTAEHTIAQFLIRAQHLRDRTAAASYIRQMLDSSPQEIADDNEYARRAHLQAIVAEAGSDTYDETNPIINEVFTMLRQTSSRAADLGDERKALRLLIDLAAVDNPEDEAAVERWQRLVRKLGDISLA